MPYVPAPWESSGSKSTGLTPLKTKSAAPAAPASQKTEDQVVRLASRIAKTQNPGTFTNQQINQYQQAFAGYKPNDILRIAKRANVPDNIAQGIANKVKSDQSPNQLPGEGFLGGVGTLLWAANRPGQAILGGITEGGEGIKKGFTGQKAYTPIRAFEQGIQGKSEKQAIQDEKNLGWAATPLNIAGSAATDPLTYVTFGTSAAGDAAAQHAAEIATAADAANAVSKADVLRSGLKAFTKDQAQAIAEQGGSRLVRAVKGAPGGVKVAGRTVVNFKPLAEKLALGERYANSPLAAVGNKIEAAFHNEAGVTQAARAGDQTMQGVAPQLSRVFASSRGRQALGADEALAKARLALRSNGINKNDYTAIRDALDVNPPAQVLTAGQQGAKDDFRSILNETIGAERQAGIQTPYLGQGSVTGLEARLNARGDNPILDAIKRMKDPMIEDPMLLKAQQAEKDLAQQYVPHVALDKTGGRRGIGGIFGTRQPGFTQQREIPGSISEINKYAETHPGATRMEENLPKLVVKRQLDSVAAVNRQQTIDDLLNIKGGTGEPVFRAARGGTAPKGLEEVAVPGVGPGAAPDRFWVPKEIKGDVERHFQNITSDSTAKDVLKLVDKYNRFWKRYAVASPGFISRNVQSNLYAASFLPERGFRATIKDYVEAAEIQRQVEKGLKDSGDAFKYLSPKNVDRFKAASDEGALQGLFTPADLAVRTTVKPALRDEGIGQIARRVAQRANPLGPDFLPTNALRTLNTTFEDNARLALFLHNQRALGDAGSAKLVFKYLFDYNDLTPFEQQTLKRISPFMTWTRKNVPLQIETLLKNPGRFSRVGQVRDELNRQAGPVKNLPIPGYIGDQGGIKFPGKLPFGMGDEGILNPDLPYRSAYETVAGPAEVLKSAAKGELDQQKLGQLITSNTGGAAGLLTGLAEAAGGKNFFTGAQYKPGQRVDSVLGKINPATLNFLEQALPVLQKGKTLAPASAADQSSQTRRLVSLFSGLGLYPLNDKTKNSALYERLNKLQAMQQTIKDTGGKVPNLTDLPGYTRPKKTAVASASGGYVKAPWQK